MTQVVSSISGLEIYSPSAGCAPTNSGDVSAIASAYVESGVSSKLDTSAQVVTSIGSGNYLGNDCIDHINGHYIHASDAGIAYMDGNFRQLSSLPDSAAVSAIASAYQVVSALGYEPYEDDEENILSAVTSINGNIILADTARYANGARTARSAQKSDMAIFDESWRELSYLPGSAEVSAIASSYAESAVSSKQDSSAMTSYALSADVSGTVDLVSTQSANWGGSALALSAGPGVSLTMVGNTLVAGLDGLDETVLWEGTLNTLNSDIACSENLSNFRTIKIFYRLVADSIVQSVGVHEFEPSEMSSGKNVSFGGFYLISNNFYGWWLGRLVVTDGYKVKITNTKNSWGTGSSPTDGTTNQSTVGYIYKIVGIGRTAGV